MATKKVIKKIKKDSGQARMTKADVNKYEVLAIYPLSVNEIAAEKELAEMIKKNGFAIVEVDKWGVKNLAYAIKKETKGYYLRFIIEKGDTKGLEKDLSFNDKILRYILVKI
jgi:small subunit ribosomal protein S6